MKVKQTRTVWQSLASSQFGMAVLLLVNSSETHPITDRQCLALPPFSERTLLLQYFNPFRNVGMPNQSWFSNFAHN